MTPVPPSDTVGANAFGSQSPIRVMFCCDPAYYQHLAVALASLLVNNRRRSLDVTIVASAQDAAAERKLLSVLPEHPDAKVTIRHFALDGFHALPTSGHITVETYLRILAINTLSSEWTKVIYLDCDLVMVAALDDLWEIDISGHALAAVPDPYGPERPRALGMPEGAPYINAGVLLINVRRWREGNLAVRLVAYAEREGSRLKYHDQDAINAVLHEQILTLPFRWNCQAKMFRVDRSLAERDQAAIQEAVCDPAIIHYTTGQKPWMFTTCVPKQTLYRRYLALTAWRDAPLTRRSLADMPEALYNRIAYACGSSCSFERFLRTTNVGRVLVRGGKAVNWAAAIVARWRGQPSASGVAIPRPASPDAAGDMLRKNMP